jgi:hypothetical protein
MTRPIVAAFAEELPPHYPMLKNLSRSEQRLAPSKAFSEAKLGLGGSCGEDRRRKGDELRQLSKVLGGGRQKELVLGSIWATEAQSTEPEDALQMSEEHLDLFSFAT